MTFNFPKPRRSLALLLGNIALGLMALPIPAGAQQATLEDAVLEIIRRNPQVVIEALQRVDPASLRRTATAPIDPNQLVRSRTQPAPAPVSEEIVLSRAADLHDEQFGVVLGNPDAKHTIVKFSDFRCGFCRRAHPTVKEVIARNPDAKVILRQFPVLGPDSENAAIVYLAAVAQDRSKAVALNDIFIAHEGPFDVGTLARLAAGIGYDADALTAAAPSFRGAIEKERELGAALGIRGTPAFVFDARLIMPGARSYDFFVSMLDQVRHPSPAQAADGQIDRRRAIEEFMATGAPKE